MVVLRFCKGTVELRGSFNEVVFLPVERFFEALRVYGSTVSFCCSVWFSGGSVLREEELERAILGVLSADCSVNEVLFLSTVRGSVVLRFLGFL